MRYVVYGLLLLLYALHTDVWYWTDDRIVLGVPIGITYHVVWTMVVSGAYWLLVQYAWPADLENYGDGLPSAVDGSPAVGNEESPARQ